MHTPSNPMEHNDQPGNARTDPRTASSAHARPRHRRTVKILAVTAGLALVAGGFAGAGTTYALAGAGSGTRVGMEQPSGGMQGQTGGMQGGGQQTGGGADTISFDYTGSYSAALAADGEEVSSSDTTEQTAGDANAALAQNGGTLALSGATLVKSGGATSDDGANFYGVNSILTAVGEGSAAYVEDSDLSAQDSGSNGIFATDGATVYASGTSITTQAANSRGLDATYGGTIVADDMDIDTSGDHSAGVATDRGGGSISVTGSEVSTAGSGSPILYSTGDIEVEGVTGTASGSQIAGMEGLNTILIKDSELTSTNTGTTGSDPVANGVIIYQSTSGDAEATTGEAATFQASGSTLTSKIQSGSMFYLTNTSASIVLQDTELDFDSDVAALLTAAGNDANNWGSAGSNGATVSFTGRNMELEGDIEADTISSVDVYLLDGTTWTGAGSITQNAAGSTSETPLTVNVDASSTWVVTEDCTISNLNVEDGGAVVDEDGDAVTIVAGGKTVVQGDSDVTVTVTGAYGTSVDAGEETELSTDLIDRTAFDERFGTDTAFTM